MENNEIKQDLADKNPWKGLNFYEEGEILYGRDDEIQSLVLYITNNIQTVLYGKSGIGKSSIINAGVFPLVRKEGLFPVPIRLKHDKDTSYIAQVKDAFKESGIGVKEILPPICEQEESLWEYLHRNLFFNKETKGSVRPLIVLDQFEEIFTLQQNENKKKAFFSELADLLNEVIPQYIINANNAVVNIKEKNPKYNSGFVLDLGMDEKDEKEEYTSESLFNIVFTIREDFLSYLERYTKYIPVMKTNRYALLPLNEEQAKDIIMKPRPGLVNIDVAKIIIENVTGRTDFCLGDAPEIDVDAAVLSLYLSRLFIKKGEQNETITSELVDETSKDIIKDFYEESVSDLPETDIEKIEDQLITYEGRRNNVSRNDLISEGVSEKAIHTLAEDKKLLRQFSYQDDIRVEYMHDILCPIVNDRIERREQIAKEKFEQKKREEENRLLQRKQEEERKKIEEDKLIILKKKSRNKKIALLLSASGIILIAILGVIISMFTQNEKQKKELETINNEIHSILPSVIEQEIKDGNSYNAGKLFLKLFPESLYVAGDPTRVSILRKLSGSQSTILNGHAQSVNNAVFSNDGNLAITGSDDMTVKIWDSRTGDLISSINNRSPIVSLAISPVEKKIVVAAKDGSLKTFSIVKGQLHLHDSVTQKGSFARFVTYNPKGTEVLACYSDGELIVYNSSNLSQNKRFKLNKKGATYISFDKWGHRMAIAGTDNTIMIWDATQYKQICTLSGHEDWVRSVDFDYNSENLVSCSDDKTIRFWNLRTKSCVIIENLPDWGTKSVFSQDGKYIISSCRDGILRFFDVATLNEIPGSQIRHSGFLNYFNISPDGSRVITCSTNPITHIWDCVNPMKTNASLRLSGAIYGISFLKRSNSIVVASNKGTLVAWNVETGSTSWKKEHIGKITSLRVSPDGEIIALSVGSKLQLYNSRNGERIEIDNTGGHHVWIHNLCFSHKGNILASVGEDNNIVLWDLDKRKVKKKIPVNISQITSVDFSKDDKKIVTGSSDMAIRQWNVTSGEQIGNPITGHKNVVLSVRYNSNDSLILSSSGDQTACLWKTDGTLVKQFVGASGYMSDAIFGLTEDEIITASADKFIRIWCSTNGKEIAKLGNHFGGISRLAISEDGILVSSDNIGGINVWKIPDLKSTADMISLRYREPK